MAYDNMHNITRKKQDMVQSGLKFGGILHAGYELNYTINAENCQQIRNIADASYRQASPATAAYQTGIPGGVELKQKTEEYGYDANGNLLSVLTGTHQGDNLQVTNSRKMLWDEENRLQAVSDNGFVSNYYYDASGERTVKLSGASQGVFVNGALNNATTQTDRFTAYINPYLVLNSGGYYSKHIYAGLQRIVSKLGSSEIFHSAPTFSSLPAGKLTGLTATIKSRYDSLGVAYHGSPQGTNGFETSASGKINTPQLYFYHPDHLGSSSLLTDNNGLLVQHLQYLPFGEVFIDERKGSWHTPFTFSAKEQDEETGLHYFSARYYDSRTSTWLSVDPLAEKYPNVSSYVYCANNPVKFVDPDGKDAILIVFPNYKIDVGHGIGRVGGLGHAGVLLIDNKTGKANYYEYGRYPTTDGTRGRVQTTKHNIKIGKDGKPVLSSLNKVLGDISKKSGQGGNIEGAYIKSDKFNEMDKFANQKLQQSNPGNSSYDKNRDPYSLSSNNCGTFAADVVNQDKSVDTPNVVFPSPKNIVNEYQEEGNAKVEYNSATKTTKVGKSNELDAKKQK